MVRLFTFFRNLVFQNNDNHRITSSRTIPCTVSPRSIPQLSGIKQESIKMSMINAKGKRLLVLGGGLSGLSYVHYLRNFLKFHKKGHLISKITILEANDYMGGSVKTNVFEDGLVHELGPRSVRLVGAKAQNTGALVEQLGLSDRVVTVTAKSQAGKDRYIYREGKLWKVPANFSKLLHKLPASKTSLIRAILNDLTQREKFDVSKCPDGDPSLYEFVTHRFGQEVAEAILDPLLRGITAGDARQLSTKALFNDMLEKEQIYGSVMKGAIKPPVTKFTHDELFPHDVLESKLLDRFQNEGAMSFNISTGLQTLPEHLSNSLLNTNDDDVISIYNRTKVLEVDFNQDEDSSSAPCKVKVKTIDGDDVTLDADHVISCMPANNLVDALPSSMPAERKQALEYLAKIPHVPVGCVTVEYRNLDKSPAGKVLNSFGLLTHSQAGSRVLGIAFDTAMFPEIDKNTDSFRMTAMIGGQWYKEIFGTENLDQVTNAQLEQITLDEISKILHLKDEPHRMTTYLWKTGIAQYRPGHVGQVKALRDNIKRHKLPLTVLGQSYDGVAVNDVIYTARIAANEFVKAL